ncbi:hypothetical protein ABFS83_06G101800 [Erythranthe nasuta]
MKELQNSIGEEEEKFFSTKQFRFRNVTQIFLEQVDQVIILLIHHLEEAKSWRKRKERQLRKGRDEKSSEQSLHKILFLNLIDRSCARHNFFFFSSSVVLFS